MRVHRSLLNVLPYVWLSTALGNSERLMLKFYASIGHCGYFVRRILVSHLKLPYRTEKFCEVSWLFT